MRNTRTVTRDGWGVSCTTGSGIEGAILKVYKHHKRPGGLRYRDGAPIPFSGIIFQQGDAYGLRFPSADAAWAYALEHGYLQPFYPRAWEAPCS